jgi:hypothetical protein
MLTLLTTGGGVMVHNATYKQYLSYIVAVSFIGEGNRSTRSKPPTCRKSLTYFKLSSSRPRHERDSNSHI